jgi:hypothetical protein
MGYQKQLHLFAIMSMCGVNGHIESLLLSIRIFMRKPGKHGIQEEFKLKTVGGKLSTESNCLLYANTVATTPDSYFLF